MEKLSCYFCKGKKNLNTFSCLHKICPDCFHNAVIYNQKSILNTMTKQPDITLKCPICSKGQFSTNRSAMLDSFKQTGGKIAEERCNTHKRPYSSFCKSCNQKLCDKCNQTHQHKEQITNNLEELKYGCSNHEGQKQLYHCKTCDTPICQICKDELHPGHDVRNITGYNAQPKDRLSKKNNDFKSNMDIIEHVDGLMDPATQQMEEQRKKLEEEKKAKKISEADYQKKNKEIEEEMDLMQEMQKMLKGSYMKNHNERKNPKSYNFDPKDDPPEDYGDSDDEGPSDNGNKNNNPSSEPIPENPVEGIIVILICRRRGRNSF
jgi:hypothetical protein